MEGTLVSYCCVTNYHKLSGLKQHRNLLSHSVCGPGFWAWLHVLCASGPHKASFTVLSRLHLNWRLVWGRIHFQAHSGCQQNLFPCSYETGGWRSPQVLQERPHAALEAIGVFSRVGFPISLLTSSSLQGESHVPIRHKR